MEIKEKILKALGLSEEVKLGYQAKLEDGTIITSSSDELEITIVPSFNPYFYSTKKRFYKNVHFYH